MNVDDQYFFLSKNVLKNEVLFENHEVCVLHWIKGGNFFLANYRYILIIKFDFKRVLCRPEIML